MTIIKFFKLALFAVVTFGIFQVAMGIDVKLGTPDKPRFCYELVKNGGKPSSSCTPFFPGALISTKADLTNVKVYSFKKTKQGVPQNLQEECCIEIQRCRTGSITFGTWHHRVWVSKNCIVAQEGNQFLVKIVPGSAATGQSPAGHWPHICPTQTAYCN